MKLIRLSILVLFSFVLPTLAHVGSPNVFFEGRAGAYETYAIIRPPSALPGIAQVSVRVNDPAVSSISLVPVLWQAGRRGSPSPVIAERVSGETSLWSAEVWFLQPGSYTIRIKIDGARGPGDASVPVNATGLASQPMPARLRATLGLFGILLFASAVLIAGGVARDASLPRGESPALTAAKRTNRAILIAFLLVSAGVAGGAVRWRKMDLAYRLQGIQKPEPVNVSLLNATNRLTLQLEPAEQSLSLPPWTALVPDHGKLMHMFLIREPDLNVFAHLHPLRVDARTFALEVPPLPSGNYQLYSDLTFESGMNQTLIARVALPEPPGGAMDSPPLTTNRNGEIICGFPVDATNSSQIVRDMDDSWHVDRSVRVRSTAPLSRGLSASLMGGYSLLLENAREVARGREPALRFAAFAPDGREAPLQPYMGMLAHAAVRRSDGSVFAHLHPSGSFSMASQEAFSRRESVLDGSLDAQAGLLPKPDEVSAVNRVAFPYEFPRLGDYRVWVQVRIAGRVLTGVYDLTIGSPKPAQL